MKYTGLYLGSILALSLACESNTPSEPEMEDGSTKDLEDSAEEQSEEDDDKSSSDDDDAGKLDRSESCILEDDPDKCGYPGGPYGQKVGKRMKNFDMKDCDNDNVELAQLFQKDKKGNLAHKVLWVNFSAGWCPPCIDETKDFGELRAKYVDQGFEIVQVLFEDPASNPPGIAFCQQWKSGSSEKSEYEWENADWRVWIDHKKEIAPIYLAGNANLAPLNMLIDANGNIRWLHLGSPPVSKIVYAEIEKVLEDPYGR